MTPNSPVLATALSASSIKYPEYVQPIPGMSESALKILRERYLKKFPDGSQEAPEHMFYRVAAAAATAELEWLNPRYDNEGDVSYWTKTFYTMMASRDFLPNSPTLMNAGTGNGLQWSACFSLRIEDSIDGIYDTLKESAIIAKSGGGVGHCFSNLRPASSKVKSTQGVASGPVSFLKLYDASTQQIKQGGCFVGSTLVATIEGPVQIKDLKAGTLVYAWDNKMTLAPCSDSWLTRKNTEVWKLVTDKGLTVYATPDHPFLTRTQTKSSPKEYCKLRDLRVGSSLMPLTRYIKDDGYMYISLQDGKDTRSTEHQWVADLFGIEGQHIHHKNLNRLDNRPSNLVPLASSEHSFLHSQLYMKDGSHPFLHLTKDQRQRGIEGWKLWFHNLNADDRIAYGVRAGKDSAKKNKERMAAGTHNFVTNHPWGSEAIKIKAKKSRVATAAWKLQEKNLPITEETWASSMSVSGFSNPHRYTKQSVISLFGTFDNLHSYMNERNHKVVSVEFSHYEDVYNVEVPGPHNFVVCDENMAGVVVSNTRRGANMGTFHDWHPDLFEFIDCKMFHENGTRDIVNFNVSVLASDAFMQAVKEDNYWNLTNPWDNNRVTATYKAREIFQRICHRAWLTGDPGLLFVDKANNSGSNPIPELETLDTTNPCGEIWINSHDACNLGSVNLSHFVTNGKVDFSGIGRSVGLAIRFLDDIIELNPFPLQKITDKVKSLRRIGLGVMGWADMLFMLHIPYNSREARNLGREVMRVVTESAVQTSETLARERGPFPLFSQSIYSEGTPRRNAQVSAVAPTGTISIIADCSSGIEPVFAFAYEHDNKQGRKLLIINPVFNSMAQEGGFYSDQLISWVSQGKPVSQFPEVLPYWASATFVTAHDVPVEDHILMQSAFQEYTENSISKSVNLPNSATVQDIADAYMLAYDTGCKGITVFRDGCLSTGQVLNFMAPVLPLEKEPCPSCKSSEAFIKESGCETCHACGYSACSVA